MTVVRHVRDCLDDSVPLRMLMSATPANRQRDGKPSGMESNEFMIPRKKVKCIPSSFVASTFVAPLACFPPRSVGNTTSCPEVIRGYEERCIRVPQRSRSEPLGLWLDSPTRNSV